MGRGIIALGLLAPARLPVALCFPNDQGTARQGDLGGFACRAYAKGKQ